MDIYKWRVYITRMGKVKKAQVGRPIGNKGVVEYCTALISLAACESICDELNAQDIRDVETARRIAIRLILERKEG